MFSLKRTLDYIKNTVKSLFYLKYRKHSIAITKSLLKRDFQLLNIECCKYSKLALLITNNNYLVFCNKCEKKRKLSVKVIAICSKCIFKQSLTESNLYCVNRFTNEIRIRCKKCQMYFNGNENSFISSIKIE